MTELEKLNAEYQVGVEQVLFSAGALRFSLSEVFPEIVSRYKILTGGDTTMRIHDGNVYKGKSRLLTFADLIKEVDKLTKKAESIVTRVRLRALNGHHNTDVTNNLDYAIYMVQRALCSRGEDVIYEEAARLSGQQDNAWSMEQQLAFLDDVTNVARRSDKDALKMVAKRASVLRDVYENPYIATEGGLKFRDISSIPNVKVKFVLSVLKRGPMTARELLTACKESRMFSRELEAKYIIDTLVEDGSVSLENEKKGGVKKYSLNDNN